MAEGIYSRVYAQSLDNAGPCSLSHFGGVGKISKWDSGGEYLDRGNRPNLILKEGDNIPENI